MLHPRPGPADSPGNPLSSTTPALLLQASILELAALSRRALPQMWNGEAHLFSHKTRIGKGGEYVNEDVNPLYSAIALIGLLEHGSPDTRDELLVGKTLDALHLKHAVGPSPALGGSLIWAASLAGDRRRRRYWRAPRARSALARRRVWSWASFCRD